MYILFFYTCILDFYAINIDPIINKDHIIIIAFIIIVITIIIVIIIVATVNVIMIFVAFWNGIHF